MKLRFILPVLMIAIGVGIIFWREFTSEHSSTPTDAKRTASGQAGVGDTAHSEVKPQPGISGNTGQASGDPKQAIPGQADANGASNASTGKHQFVFVTDPNGAPSQGMAAAAAGANTSANASTGQLVKGLNFATPPPEYAAFATTEMGRLNNLRHFTDGDLQLGQPIPYYELYATLAQGENYNDAQFQNAYIYILENNGKAVYSAGVGPGFSGGLRSFSGFTSYAQQIDPDLQYLAGLEQVASGSYEVRLTHVGDITSAIWLKSATGNDDLFYILSQIITVAPETKIPPGTVMKGSDFQAIVGARAQAEKNALSRRQGRGGP